ncbi:MAG: type II secretion system F family protein [Actinobacteria bacterium]|nr:type II secretion system F family protein [Actinomycetota bacterium]
MNNTSLLIAGASGLAGLAFVAAGVARGRRAPAADATTYLHQLDQGFDDDADADEYSKRMRQSFVARTVRPVAAALAGLVTRVTPRQHILRIHQQLLLAGLTTQVRAEEFVTMQVLSTGLGLLLGIGVATLTKFAPGQKTLFLVLLPAVGALLPQSWLSRKVAERKESIFKDLPDVLDLLAISVEAGVGFEGAMEVVCSHFTSPLALEFSRTLKEMELGLPRREALHNLKRRTEVPELSNFVQALTQADALGMPIGRVLHTQAHEMRTKRKQWAREKAGKLPVKIMFPLVVFIFPAILVVILGPAASSITKGLGH